MPNNNGNEELKVHHWLCGIEFATFPRFKMDQNQEGI